MQKIQFLLVGWVMILTKWFNTKFGFISGIFSKFDLNNPEHLEALTGTIMNVLGILSLLIGIYLAIRNSRKLNRK